jgi:hypothetical protein
MDQADVYRIFHLTSAQHTFFSADHGTLSKIDHILGHKARLSNALKLELNSKNNRKKIFKHLEAEQHIAQ